MARLLATMRLVRTALLALVAALSFWSAALALDPTKNIDQFGHDFWTSQNGLIGEAVYQILQSPDGYLWLRTSAGLVRFDGVRFVLIQPVVNGKPISEPVGAICLGASGDLLVRTTSHTLIYKNGVFSDYLLASPLPNGAIRTIFESRQHDVFIGADGFIYLLRGSSIEMLCRHTGWVDSFYEDAQGTVWIFGAAQLFAFRDNQLFVIPGHYGAFGFTLLAEDSRHRVWAGARNGLYLLSSDHRSARKFLPEVVRSEVRAVLEDRQGNFWIATSDRGLIRVVDNRTAIFGQPNSLTDNRVLALYEDREGSLWVGTASGLDRFRDTKLTTITTDEGLPSNLVTAVLQVRDGSVFAVCRGGGLARMRNGAITTFGAKQGLSNLYPTAVFESRDGSLWLGPPGELVRFKNGTFTNYTAKGRLVRNNISAINEDDESLILATDETLAYRFKNDTLVPFTFDGQTTPLSRPGNYIFTIYRDRQGTLWFGTVEGLFKFAKGEPPSQAQQPEIKFPVTGIFDDGEGSLWLAGRIPGLTQFRLRDGRVTRYTSEAGLFDDYPTSVLFDEAGNLWISTGNGIYEAGRKDLEDFAEGRISRVPSIVYNTADGMKTSEATGPGNQPGGWRTRDGKLWFVTKKGVVVVDPNHLARDTQPPPVVIEGVTVDDALVPLGPDLQIGPRTDRIEFHYTALSLRIPSRVRFKYILEGHDHDWVDAGTRRVAYYDNLPPGDYRFRVIASNGDRVWNEAGATLPFTLRPAFYQTFWFYGFVAILIVLTAGAAQRLYTQQLRRRAVELEKRVQERTRDLAQANQALAAASSAKSEFLANMSHEIRTPLNGVVGMTELALGTELTLEQREYLETVKVSADTLLTVINDILDFSKIEAGKIDLELAEFDLRDALDATLRTLALRADEKGLELLCDMAPDVPEIVKGDSTRIRQIILNLVGNAIKFTQEGEVSLRVEVDSVEGTLDVLHFIVSDTGIGIPRDKLKTIFDPFFQADSSITRKYGGTGLGLSIASRLVRLMGGRIWADSEVGLGTQFHFTLELEAVERKANAAASLSPLELPRDVNVLVVDDNGTNRRILEQMLTRWRMSCSGVESGEEALQALLEAQHSGAPYNLLLTDRHMPGMDGFELVRHIREIPELSAATIMMLTSSGHRGDAALCQELHVSAYLIKPIRQAELREAILRVLRAAGEMQAIAAAPRLPKGCAERSTVRHVLVAEDNGVNQRLIGRLLEKRGHRVTLVANGREALDALDKEAFDLVLMDVQMPEMDGYEATQALRAKENGTGAHIPVVALTAHAMKGDRERCLAAGMDDYMAKPIHPHELDAILDKHLFRCPEAVPAPVGSPQQS